VKKTGLAALGGIFPIPTYFINPDQVAKDLTGNFSSQEEHDRAAHNASISMRQTAIEHRQTFAFETVMSHTSRINEIINLKKQGYHVLLVFITTDDPEKMFYASSIAINPKQQPRILLTQTKYASAITGHWHCYPKQWKLQTLLLSMTIRLITKSQLTSINRS
jgi:hypothetical protein